MSVRFDTRRLDRDPVTDATFRSGSLSHGYLHGKRHPVKWNMKIYGMSGVPFISSQRCDLFRPLSP